MRISDWSSDVCSSELFESVRFGTTCTDWLIRLFDDEAETVRHEASDCFRRMRTSAIASHAGLFEAYVASRYFETARTYSLPRLEHAQHALAEPVLTLLEVPLQARTRGNHDPRASERSDKRRLGYKCVRT